MFIHPNPADMLDGLNAGITLRFRGQYFQHPYGMHASPFIHGTYQLGNSLSILREPANVKHFFALLGKMFFTPYGKEFFTYLGKQIFTS